MSADRAFAVEDYLYNRFAQAATAGGVLAGVQIVRRQCPPSENIFPAVGVAFEQYRTAAILSGSTYDREATFAVTAALKADFSEQQPDTVERGRLALRQYVNDGNGHGVIPLLQSDPTLGALASASWIESLQYIPYQPQGRAMTAGAVVVAWITLRVNYRTR